MTWPAIRGSMGSTRTDDQATDVKAGRALGWMSLALGAAEVAAPHLLQRYLGLRRQEGVLRALGIREIAQGIGILGAKDPTPGLWARVAGDALDLAVLGTAVKKSARPDRMAGAIAMVVGITLIDAVVAMRNQRHHPDEGKPD